MNIPLRTGRQSATRHEQPERSSEHYRDRYLVELARLLVSHSNQRAAFLPGLMFEDPQWLMTLELFIAAGDGREVSVTGLCASSGVPSTTALRHIRNLERKAVFERVSHPRDKRISHVRLSESGHRQVALYLGSIGSYALATDAQPLRATH